MPTLEERVAVLEEAIPTLATKAELNAVEERLTSRIYTVRGDLLGKIDTKVDTLGQGITAAMAAMEMRLLGNMTTMEKRILDTLHSNGKGPG